jgi:hypothetical protein
LSHLVNNFDGRAKKQETVQLERNDLAIDHIKLHLVRGCKHKILQVRMSGGKLVLQKSNSGVTEGAQQAKDVQEKIKMYATKDRQSTTQHRTAPYSTTQMHIALRNTAQLYAPVASWLPCRTTRLTWDLVVRE